MNDDQYAFFQRLVESTGPSGYEWNTQRVWRDRVANVAERVETDAMGNAIAVLNPSGNPRVMLDAHIDEIGFLVKYIDDDGFVYFDRIGGFDPSTLPGNRVRFTGKNGPVYGVIGRAPVHLLDDDARKKMPELKTMWIDIGAASRAEAEALLSIGDAGGRAAGMQRLQGSIVTANSIDDRVGCYIMAEALRNLASQPAQAAVFAASAVQEEIGLRGAKVTAYAVEPQIGLSLEVTWTSDHPYATRTEHGDIRVGRGPVISRGATTNPRIFERLVAAAESEGIPYQIQADAYGGSTDEHVIQVSRSGVATGLVSVPTRYLHTASELLSTDDVDAAVRLVTRFVRDLGPDMNLTP